MLMMACPKCHGFPAQIGDALLSCCYLASIAALNMQTAEATPDMLAGLWAWTAKYRAGKRAEYGAVRAVFARREKRP